MTEYAYSRYESESSSATSTSMMGPSKSSSGWGVVLRRAIFRAAPALRAAMRVTALLLRVAPTLRCRRPQRGLWKVLLCRLVRRERTPIAGFHPRPSRFRESTGPHAAPQVSGWTHAQLAAVLRPPRPPRTARRHRAQWLLPGAGRRGGRGRG